MMNMNSRELGQAIHDKARELGADLVGIARIADLKRSPSHTIIGKIASYNGVGTIQEEGQDQAVVTWPQGFKSAIVIAIAHPVNEPELDWWFSGNSDGNRHLIRIVSGLADWLENGAGFKCSRLPYHIERGGIYLKDAAVLAGLGCIGRNNLFITPQYGPRLRLRALLTQAELPSTGDSGFDPCHGCSAPCLEACPRNAFAEQVYSPAACGQSELPGRSGTYDRLACNREMVINEANFEEVRLEDQEKTGKRVKYCRECELSCPI
jgi:epoxyqueuosine reductase